MTIAVSEFLLRWQWVYDSTQLVSPCQLYQHRCLRSHLRCKMLHQLQPMQLLHTQMFLPLYPTQLLHQPSTCIALVEVVPPIMHCCHVPRSLPAAAAVAVLISWHTPRSIVQLSRVHVVTIFRCTRAIAAILFGLSSLCSIWTYSTAISPPYRPILHLWHLSNQAAGISPCK